MSSGNENSKLIRFSALNKINHEDVRRMCHAKVVQILDTLKSNAVVLEVTRPEQRQLYSAHSSKFVGLRHSTLAPTPKSVVQRSVSMAGRVSHNNGPAPYSPMLPMHAPPHSRCISPGESSVSSTGIVTVKLPFPLSTPSNSNSFQLNVTSTLISFSVQYLTN